MLVHTSSPLHHCSSGSTNNLPPGVLQPEPAPAPTGGPTTNSCIAQPGTAYASAGRGHHWTPEPRLVYWSPGNYCTLRQCPVPLDNPPRRTTGVRLPTSIAPFPSSQSATLPPYPYEAYHRRSSLPHMRLRSQPAVLDNVSQRLLQTDAADPHPIHGKYLGVRSAAAPPTATAFQSRPVYQPHPYHSSIMDETGLFSKDTQRIIDRFVADIGGQDSSRRFKGVVNHKTATSLDMTNDPVIFAEHFRTGFAGRKSWTLPADQPGLGDQLYMPVKDERTPVRVAVLLRLLPDHCLVKTPTNKMPSLPYQPST